MLRNSRCYNTTLICPYIKKDNKSEPQSVQRGSLAFHECTKNGTALFTYLLSCLQP